MRRAGKVVLAFFLATVACGDGTATTTSAGPAETTAITPSTTAVTTTTAEPATTSTPDTLPPHDFADLAEIFDPLVAPLGYELSRGALIDRSSYEVDPEGGHLALYLAPLEDISFDTYASDFPHIAEELIPMVFATWPDLESFDVCQEEFASSAATPPSLTIVDLTAEAAAGVSWDELDLTTLIGYGNEVDGISVWARTGVMHSDTWQEAATG